MAAERLTIIRTGDWSLQLIVLCLFLGLLLITGGSSRYDIPQLVLLRPIAVCVLGFALATIQVDAWRNYKSVLVLFASAFALTALHLIPLPPHLWQALPGRQIVAEIDTAAGLQGIWRPLTMFPEGTWNALYSLCVPLAALLLAAQLNQRDLARVLVWVVVLSLVTGLVGVWQAAGSDIKFYRVQSATAGLFANRNHQAAMLACAFPMLGAAAMLAPHFRIPTRAARIVCAAIAITLIPLILVTGSRMGLAAAVLAFLYTGVVILRQGEGGRRRPYQSLTLVASGLAVAAVMVMASIYAARDVAIDRIGVEAEDLRWQFWSTVIDFLPQYLPWGTGVGSFVPVYQIHEPAGMLLPQYVNQAHNDWLDIALTSGVPGIVLALIAVAMLARATGAALITRGLAGHIRRAGVGTILVLAFASLSDYPLRTPALAAVFAVAVIWAWAPLHPNDNEESKKPNAEA